MTRSKNADPQSTWKREDSHKQPLVQPSTALALLRRPTLESASLLVGPPPSSCSSAVPPWTHLSLGINQLSGPAGCAKTQMALSLCLQAALRGSQRDSERPRTGSPATPTAAIYLSLGSTRHAKMAQRLDQMARSTLENSSHSRRTDILRRILIKAVLSPEDLLSLCCPERGELASVLGRDPHAVRVLVLDDIAALFRVLEGSVVARSAALFTLAARLKRLSETYQVPVLVLNQVTSRLSAPTNALSTKDHHDEPALGLSWAQCVNQSYAVRRSEPGKGGRGRVLRLERSPRHAPQDTPFQVLDAGVVMGETSVEPVR